MASLVSSPGPTSSPRTDRRSPGRFMSSSNADDPFVQAMQPPPDETPEERELRLQTEEEARRISEAIDEAIKQERLQAKKKKIVKLLLLGQSESGKSTTLRQFQRLYTPSAFREERVLWRAVIQLNIVRSIRIILENLASDRNAIIESLSGGEDSDFEEHPSFSEEIDKLHARLLPLRHIEQLLIAKLVPPNEDEATDTGFSRSYHYYGLDPHRQKELTVRPGSWKRAVAKGKGSPDRSSSPGSGSPDSPDEATTVLYQCRHDMLALWHNTIVQSVLKKRKVRLEDQPGFFLDQLERITSLKYSPSENDVLKARLKTVGVSEYRFEMESAAGRDVGTEWRIIDVGGSRSQRQTWIPFFDDVDAIIFLAPISGFDQSLAEDRTVNRLEDSVLIWKMICSNKMLANVDLVLFLNKCDILDRKLRSGTKLVKYVRSYHERSNDAETAQNYFRAKFNAIHREYSPNPRKFYGFCTSVTEITTTSGILASVRDMVVREHLRKSRLI